MKTVQHLCGGDSKVEFTVDEHESEVDFTVDVRRGAISVGGNGKATLFVFATSASTVARTL